jgi:ABC-type oligopeptide transport system substrate-binding subunit
MPPTLTPTATDTPEPTAVPGVELIPVSELANQVPWLPANERDLPMSVYYGFNMEKPPFDKLLVRQAFAAAVDRQAVADKALEYRFPDAKPATTLTPAIVLGRDLYNQVGVPFDPARAKELLKEAGYDSPGSLPEITLLVSTRGKGAPGAYYQMAKDVIAMWEGNLGVTVKLEVLEMPAFLARMESDPPGMFWMGWVADYNDPDNYLNALFRSGVQANRGHFANAAFDRLVVEARRVTDPLERQLRYIQAEQVLAEQETALIPLFHSLRPTPYVW